MILKYKELGVEYLILINILVEFFYFSRIFYYILIYFFGMIGERGFEGRIYFRGVGK